MKKKVSICVMLASVIISIVLLCVFIPHFQDSVRSSGGVLEIQFEDGAKQYVAKGGSVRVEIGSKCKIKAITSMPSSNYSLSVKNGSLAEDGEIIFDKQGLYVFDLYLSSGNFVADFYVEAV